MSTNVKNRHGNNFTAQYLPLEFRFTRGIFLQHVRGHWRVCNTILIASFSLFGPEDDGIIEIDHIHGPFLFGINFNHISNADACSFKYNQQNAHHSGETKLFIKFHILWGNIWPISSLLMPALKRCHIERNGVSNCRHLDSLLNRLFMRRSQKACIKAPRHWPLWMESNGERWSPLTKG